MVGNPGPGTIVALTYISLQNHSYEIKLISIQSLLTLAPRPHEYSHKRFLLHSTQKVKFEVARTLLPEGSLSDFDNMVEKITAPDDDGLLHALALLFFRLKDDFIVKIEVNPVTASLLEHVPDWSSIMAARIFRS
ncbi:hypothetical protein FRB99_001387 [Tulasnella sp. 403]|nr:hypothetical protein FRB99_001387 [Tulasnella sp. 403]